MDYTKLDASLNTVLPGSRQKPGVTIQVFIHTVSPIDQPELAILRRHGIRAERGATVITALLTPDSIADLSDQPWIRSLKLAKQSRPLKP